MTKNKTINTIKPGIPKKEIIIILIMFIGITIFKDEIIKFKPYKQNIENIILLINININFSNFFITKIYEYNFKL